MGYTGSQRYGSLSVNPSASEFLKKEDNSDLVKTVGTYHVIPGFYYANNLNLNYLKYIYPVNGSGQLDTTKMGLDGKGGDYSTHYYPQEQAAMTVKVEMGNLRFAVGGDSDLNGGDIFFQIPKPKNEWEKFVFDLEKEEEQIKEYQTIDIWKDGKKYKSLYPVTITCNYEPSNGSYTIHFYWIEERNDGKYKVDLGTYVWKPGDDDWTCKNAGTGGTGTKIE